MKKLMPKLLIALATLVGGTYVLQAVQPFAEKKVEAATEEESDLRLGEGDVFTYGSYTPIAGTGAGTPQELNWRIVYANKKTGEGVAMTEQPIEQASQGWNTNCYYAANGAGNCTNAPWTSQEGIQQNKSILTTAQPGITTDNAEIKGQWINAYFGGSVADWMDRYFVPNFIGSIQGSSFGNYVANYHGENKDQKTTFTTPIPVQVDWTDNKGNRVLANSNGDDKQTKPTVRGNGTGSMDDDGTGMYNPYVYTMPFAYTNDGSSVDKGNPPNGVIDDEELTENGYPGNAKFEYNALAGHDLPVGEKYGVDNPYYYPSTWISYS